MSRTRLQVEAPRLADAIARLSAAGLARLVSTACDRAVEASRLVDGLVDEALASLRDHRLNPTLAEQVSALGERMDHAYLSDQRDDTDAAGPSPAALCWFRQARAASALCIPLAAELSAESASDAIYEAAHALVVPTDLYDALQRSL